MPGLDAVHNDIYQTDKVIMEKLDEIFCTFLLLRPYHRVIKLRVFSIKSNNVNVCEEKTGYNYH